MATPKLSIHRIAQRCHSVRLGSDAIEALYAILEELPPGQTYTNAQVQGAFVLRELGLDFEHIRLTQEQIEEDV